MIENSDDDTSRCLTVFPQLVGEPLTIDRYMLTNEAGTISATGA